MPWERHRDAYFLDDFPSTEVQKLIFLRSHGTRPEGDEGMGGVLDRDGVQEDSTARSVSGCGSLG